MTEENQEDKKEVQDVSDKELNFRRQQQKYEAMLAKERQEREDAIRRVQAEYEQKLQSYQRTEDDDDDDYIDRKRLQKQFQDFEKNLESKFDKKAEQKALTLLQQKEREQWLKNNQDFYDVLEKHADRFAEQYPGLAEDILTMPEGFQRQRLVYQNIKTLGIDKPKESIQQTVDQKRQSPYYQPTNIGSAPSGVQGDFSPQGQRNAYEKMQELKSRLRI